MKYQALFFQKNLICFLLKISKLKIKIVAIPTNFRQNSLIIMYNVSINLHCICVTARFTCSLSKIFIETKDNKQLCHLIAYDSCNPFFAHIRTKQVNNAHNQIQYFWPLFSVKGRLLELAVACLDK